MRALTLWLMLVLLPLRLWAGAAMLPGQLPPSHSDYASPPACHASAQADQGHAHGAVDAATKAPKALEASTHGAHALCDLCQSPLYTSASVTLTVPLLPRAQAIHDTPQLHEVEPLPELRPPIA
jgi:hypothetical protein